MSRQIINQTVLTDKAATGVGLTVSVADSQHLILTLATSNSANCKIKIYGSAEESSPDFSAAQSVTNIWSPIGIYDLDNGSFSAGSSGIVLTGTDVCKLYEVNSDGLRWITVVVTDYTAGKITAHITQFSNL